MKTFTITLAWGQSDEGNYHWAGQAKDEDTATQIAREEMDASYNEQYNRGVHKSEWRGKEGGEETTEYMVVDCVEGVNEFAATDMLSALRMVAAKYRLDRADQAAVRKAIARGEGRA